MLTRIAMGIVCSLALMLQSSQNYPTKPVRMVEPFGAGHRPALDQKKDLIACTSTRSAVRFPQRSRSLLIAIMFTGFNLGSGVVGFAAGANNAWRAIRVYSEQVGKGENRLP